MAGLHRSMWHVVLSSGDMNVSTSTTATGADTTLNDVLRTACGHQFPSHKLHTSVALKLTSGLRVQEGMVIPRAGMNYPG